MSSQVRTHLQVKHPLRDRLRAAGSAADRVGTAEAFRLEIESMSEVVDVTMTTSSTKLCARKIRIAWDTLPTYPVNINRDQKMPVVPQIL